MAEDPTQNNYSVRFPGRDGKVITRLEDLKDKLAQRDPNAKIAVHAQAKRLDYQGSLPLDDLKGIITTVSSFYRVKVADKAPESKALASPQPSPLKNGNGGEEYISKTYWKQYSDIIEADIARLTGQVEEAEREYFEVLEVLQAADDKARKSAVEMTELRAELKEVYAARNSALEYIVKLEANVESAHLENSALDKKRGELSYEVEQDKMQIQDITDCLGTERDLHRKEIEGLGEKIRQLTEEIQQSAAQSQAQVQELTGRLSQADRTIEDLNKGIERVREDYEDGKSLYAILDEENRALEQRATTAEATLAPLRAQIGDLMQQRDDLQKSVQGSEADLDSSYEIASTLEARGLDLTQRLEGAKAQHDQDAAQIQGFRQENELLRMKASALGSPDTLMGHLLVAVGRDDFRSIAAHYESLFPEGMSEHVAVAVHSESDYVLGDAKIQSLLAKVRIDSGEYKDLAGLVDALEEAVRSELDPEIGARYDVLQTSLPILKTKQPKNKEGLEKTERMIQYVREQIRLIDDERKAHKDYRGGSVEALEIIRSRQRRHSEARASAGIDPASLRLEGTVRMFAYITEGSQAYHAHLTLPIDEETSRSGAAQGVIMPVLEAVLARHPDANLVTAPQWTEVRVAYAKQNHEKSLIYVKVDYLIEDAQKRFDQGPLARLGVRLDIDRSFMTVGLRS